MELQNDSRDSDIEQLDTRGSSPEPPTLLKSEPEGETAPGPFIVEETLKESKVTLETQNTPVMKPEVETTSSESESEEPPAFQPAAAPSEFTAKVETASNPSKDVSVDKRDTDSLERY